VDVVIRIERAEPPVGTVRRVGALGRGVAEEDAEIPFEGWLGLMRALSEVFGEARD
jgi:hypothetical protein